MDSGVERRARERVGTLRDRKKRERERERREERREKKEERSERMKNDVDKNVAGGTE